MGNWYEDDRFWETFAPVMFTEQRWANAPIEVDRILVLLSGIYPGSAILDLCCGPGRHALELKRRGFRVTGVDRTAPYLEEARRRAHEEGLAIEFVQDDMRHFSRPGAFNAALSMFTSFGYFAAPADNCQVLANIYQSLKPGGALLMEMNGKEKLARDFRPRDWEPLGDGFFLEDRRVTNDWSWMENRWIILRGGEKLEFQISHWIYSARELKEMLAASGFSAVDIYGDLEGAPYDHTAKRLVALARK